MEDEEDWIKDRHKDTAHMARTPEMDFFLSWAKEMGLSHKVLGQGQTRFLHKKRLILRVLSTYMNIVVKELQIQCVFPLLPSLSLSLSFDSVLVLASLGFS